MKAGKSSVILVVVILFAVVVYFYQRSGAVTSTKIVSIASGDLQGTMNPKTGIASFKGIPYAAPPVELLRWAPPAPAVFWKGVRQADAHGPMCVQTVGGEGPFLDLMMDGVGLATWKKWIFKGLATFMVGGDVSEDCLTLAVWGPADSGASDADPHPVMVWFHGGAHKFGAGDTARYDATKLAQRGVVVVSVNYRLGVLGFMAHPELTAESTRHSSGNYGTLDQIYALRWVKENIHAFGGDPDNVTIFGESAGAHSVGQIMASPLSTGLFQRAIAQSGIGTHQVATLQQGERAGMLLASKLGITGEKQITAMRAMPAEEINAIFSIEPELDVLSHPVVDGWVLPQSTAAIFAAGKQAPVPFMIGTNADEGTLLAPLVGSPFENRLPGPKTAGQYHDLILDEYPENGERIFALYPADTDAEVPAAVSALFGDHLFGMQAWYAAALQSKLGQPTYVYFLTRISPSVSQWAGAYHGSDIQFVFGNFFPLFPRNDYDDALSDQVIGYWTQFARTGDPNHQGWPEWSTFDALNPQEMELGRRVGMRPVARREKYELLVTAMARLL